MKMDNEALQRLGRDAAAFGRAYAAVKDALLKEGVPLDEAREEARLAAAIAAMVDEVPEGGNCPLCGGSGEL